MLETERLRLRNWQPSDREPFARLNADPRVMEFFPKLLTREESDAMVDRIEEHFRLRGFGLYAAELRSNGKFIGYIGLHTPTFTAHFTPCVEIGWRITSDDWGQGLATEGARAVGRHAVQQLALSEIVSFTVPANVRSIRVMEKIGMTRNPAEDFEHPNLPVGHALRRHVLYRLKCRDAVAQFEAQNKKGKPGGSPFNTCRTENCLCDPAGTALTSSCFPPSPRRPRTSS